LKAYKNPPNSKIELLYFLGVGWIHRAIEVQRRHEVLTKWWGNNNWEHLKDLNCWQMADTFRRRFEDELGYRFSAAYPIFDRNKGGRVMYYMIHASDHKDAPALMVRAHRKAVRAIPPDLQLSLKGWE
jgi:three-Cys-motif partner protein